MSATTDNVLVILGAALPGATARAMKLALHEIVGEFCRDVLQVPGPTVPSSDIDDWMSDAQWVEHHRLIIDGTLARMYGEPGRPYSNTTLAQAHLGFWMTGLARARSVATSGATAANTVERIMNVARAEVPGARDGAIQQALFLTVDELNRQVLQITPPQQTDLPPAWLSADNYAEHQRLLIDGVLSSLFGQVGQPWANPENAKFHLAKWLEGLGAARANATSSATAQSAPERIMNVVRAEVPGARDATIQQALFQCVDRLARAALQATPPAQSTAFTTWLNAADYAQHHGLLIQGTLGVLFAQVGQSWANADGAKLHTERWEAGLIEARAVAAANATATDPVDRIMALVRTEVPTARDAAIQQAMFFTTDALARDWLQITPPLQSATAPNWLPEAIYAEHFKLIAEGTLATLFAQVGQPWFNADGAKLHAGNWTQGLIGARSFEAASKANSTSFERMLTALRVGAPGARDAVIYQELFVVVDELARQWLQTTPPDSTNEPRQWLTPSQYGEHYRLLIDGVLARLLVQEDARYANPPLAEGHAKAWLSGLQNARILSATGPSTTTAYSRLIANLRGAVPGLRDDALLQEVFNVVDDLTRNILQVTPPSHSATSENWLTPALWDAHYRLIFAGTMVRTLTQPGKPWTDPSLAAIQQGIYSDLVTLARGDANSAGTVPSPIERIMDNCRVKLSGSKDAVIQQELFNTIDELCRVSFCWRQNTPVRLVADRKVYVVTPTGTDVIEVVSIQHNSLDMSAVKYNYGSVYLSEYPRPVDLNYPVFVTMHLAPSPLNTDPEDWLPTELLLRHVQTLVDGVCMRMMLQAGKPYSNPTLAQYHGRRFRNAMAQATIDMRSRDVMGQSTWRFPRFAR